MHAITQQTDALYGLMAEFDSAQAVLDAAKKAVDVGFTRVEAYTPIPIEELNDLLHKKRTKLPLFVLLGGLAGMAAGFALQWGTSVIVYPMNVGGRPFASWPSFIVPSYELTILFSAIAAAAGMILFNGLPQPYHPVFNVERFSLASSDKFFLVIEAADPRFERDAAARLFEDVGAKGVYDVAE